MILAAALNEHNVGFHLHRHNRLTEAEPFYQRAVALDPDFTDAWLNLGLALLSLGRADEAMVCQREALRLDPESADAQNNLGMVHYTQGHIAEAENCFRAALRLRPNHANATLNLGSARQILNHVEDAEALFCRALTLGTNPAHAKSNLALALMEQARPEEAELLCREALALRPGYPEARANLALALMKMGRLEEGWREYESRWDVESMASPAPVLSQPRWTGQQLNGETIVLYAEQGFGDTLQFCRYATHAAERGLRVVMEVPRPLLRLLRSVQGVAHIVARGDVLPEFDLQCPMLSMPLALGTTLATIPASPSYLHAEPAQVAAWRTRLAARGDGRKRIGLVWAGNPRSHAPDLAAIDRRRSIAPELLAPLLALPGLEFFALQKDGPPAPARFALTDHMAEMNDFADTAALIANLDLVISVDTAVAHLAAALGVPVWVLDRFDSCWRWLVGRRDTPWYPTLRLYRQPSPGDWDAVIADVARDLREGKQAVLF